MEDEVWMTVKEAALFTGVSVQTVYSWVRRGHLTVTGLGHRGQKLFRHLDVARAELGTRAKSKRALVTTAARSELFRRVSRSNEAQEHELSVLLQLSESSIQLISEVALEAPQTAFEICRVPGPERLLSLE
ncbi:helix-turn-helix domain-containing protein [Streptomyces anulatus]|uniref:helix-turn-helix domain-containing protein n=1 Tax=Streptomyces anulatus TaxID=1892 RepID=UPI003434CA6D